MQWYEIIALCFALLCLGGLVTCLFYISYRDYNLKEKKLEFDKKKHNDIECDLSHIYSILDEINEKIKE